MTAYCAFIESIIAAAIKYWVRLGMPVSLCTRKVVYAAIMIYMQ
jgi:hypothetical protein